MYECRYEPPVAYKGLRKGKKQQLTERVYTNEHQVSLVPPSTRSICFERERESAHTHTHLPPALHHLVPDTSTPPETSTYSVPVVMETPRADTPRRNNVAKTASVVTHAERSSRYTTLVYTYIYQ